MRHSTTMDLRSLLTCPPRLERDGVLTMIDDQRDDYCANFGSQWNRFGHIQLDSASGSRESHQRFFNETGWSPDELRGKVLLDAGCGAGRFAEVALEAGAQVVAVDISSAAYACRQNLERFPREQYLVLRASILELPLRSRAFDGVYSLGVLQHTPDPLAAVRHLAEFVSPGGRLATWIYELHAAGWRWPQPRTWLRKITRHWSDPAKLRMSRALTAAFFPAGWALSWFGRPGEKASWLLPYAARHHMGRGSVRRQWQYSVLDTFDWYGPAYELSQREADVRQAMLDAGLTNVRRLPARGMAIVGDRSHARPTVPA